ncbi:MAG: hypothetical protein AB4290_27230 [Spirulina sp.]
MTKTIDRDRLIQAMEKTDAYKKEIAEPVMDVLRVFCAVGLKSTIHKSFGNSLDMEIENGRIQAVLAYHGLTANAPDLLENLWSIIDPIVDRRRYFLQKMTEIQEQYQISGLREETILLGAREVKVLTDEEPLAILDSDLDILREAKPKIIEAVASHCKRERLRCFYRNNGAEDGWMETEIESLIVNSYIYDHVKVDRECYFISPEKMRSQKHDYRRSKPVYQDDELHYEVNVILGRTTDFPVTSIDTPSLWYCLTNGHIPAL